MNPEPGYPEPRSVRIGPFDYEIRWMDRIEAGDCQSFGLHNGNDQCVRLKRNRKRQRVGNTFMHEVFHAINQVFGTQEDKRGKVSEESAVSGLAFGHGAFCRDNPEALAWYLWLVTVNPGLDYETAGAHG